MNELTNYMDGVTPTITGTVGNSINNSTSDHAIKMLPIKP